MRSMAKNPRRATAVTLAAALAVACYLNWQYARTDMDTLAVETAAAATSSASSAASDSSSSSSGQVTDALLTEAEAASARFHDLTEQLRQTEADLAYTSELMGAVVQYAKTRPMFDEYKAAKYGKRFLAQHEAELADYRAAKAALNDLLDGAKLPKMAQLKEKRRKLAREKKVLYAKYRAAQQEMRQAVAVKTNIDYLLGATDGRKNKEQER